LKRRFFVSDSDHGGKGDIPSHFFILERPNVVSAGEYVVGPDEAARSDDLLIAEKAADLPDGRIGVLKVLHLYLSVSLLGFLLDDLPRANILRLILL
jgi:hypothetical protein